MLKTKFLISLILTISVLALQAGAALPARALQAPRPITGIVQRITVETDIDTGITTVLVAMMDQNHLAVTARINEETAITLALVTLDGDGKPAINRKALGQSIEVDPTTVIPDDEVDQHPVGSALATFFSNIAGLDYDQIMSTHDKGVGFGVIAQALWLTMKFEGDSEVFLAILDAKETGDYSAFILDDGTTPKNWGELRNAILEGSDKKDKPGLVMSNKDKENDNRSNPVKEKEKDNNGQDKGNKNDNGNGKGNGKKK
jgi:spore cortex formation protein SpoVR/YcgB (stage V sporulation)